MTHDMEEMPRSSLRSIPPVAGLSVPPSGRRSRVGSTWLGAAAMVGVLAGVALAVQRVGGAAADALGSGAQEPAGQRGVDGTPGLRTVVVRGAPRRPMVRSRDEARGAVAVVPRSAVARLDGKAMVFVAEQDLHLLVATPVELGAAEGDEQRVLAGLSAGQVVVTEGVAQLEKRATHH